jgi:Bacterial pre-peptidase C-terminal domain
MKAVAQGCRAAALAALLAACNGDGGGGGGGTDPAQASGVSAASATTQNGSVGANVAEAPAVRVVDQHGGLMPGVNVRFTVVGGGTLGATSVTTDASGVASAGSWRLGPNPGTQTVTATVTGLSPVVFTATVADPCETVVAYTLLSTLAAALSAADCRVDSGEYVDFYSVTLPSAQAVSITMSSSAVNSWLEMFDPTGRVVAINNNVAANNTNASVSVFAPSGNYFLAATSNAAGETGAYQLSSAPVTANEACGEYWVAPGVLINGTISTTDCNYDGYLTDTYLVVLYPGQTLTAKMESSAFNAYLELYNTNGNRVADNEDGAGGTNALMTYTNSGTNPGIFYLDASGSTTGLTGAYALTVTRTGGQALERVGAARAGAPVVRDLPHRVVAQTGTLTPRGGTDPVRRQRAPR